MREIDLKTGCWVWKGATARAGYGSMRINGKTLAVHRLMAVLCFDFHAHEREAQILHKCDNPPCFNPEHLFIGDAKANMQDMLTKNRQKKWRKPNARDYAVLKLRLTGSTWRAIERELNISDSYAQQIFVRFQKDYGQRALDGECPPNTGHKQYSK